MAPQVLYIYFLTCIAIILAKNASRTRPQKLSSCYNKDGQPQRCIPKFENAAFMKKMEATNTCGDNSVKKYCIRSSTEMSNWSCHFCRPGQFSSYYLTDFHGQNNWTWWQSETMRENIQYPKKVNLTLHLGKAYDITYIKIIFHSPRPESFAIYKKTNEDSDWQPFQYFSASCPRTYGIQEQQTAELGAETKALCTSEYSDITPLSGGNVLFSTLEGRPSAYMFDKSPELQEWVTATDLRISLDLLNFFDDENLEDEKVLQSYWYAIADVDVSGRCKCNGHAASCGTQGLPDGSTAKYCRCEHNTAGRECEKCLDFYNDAPWGRATSANIHECKVCNCNGFSNKCYFDKDLYERTGHGSHCTDCAGNRDGARCERCKENYYRGAQDVCRSCDFNLTADYVKSDFSKYYSDRYYTIVINRELAAGTEIRMRLSLNVPLTLYNPEDQLTALKNNEYKIILGKPTNEFKVKVYTPVSGPTVALLLSLKIEGCDFFRNVSKSLCGKRKVSHNQLIVYGELSKPGDWPWHVALNRIYKSIFRYMCGGTLISEYYVLTAAHCVTRNGLAILPESIGVSLGKHSLIGGDIDPQEREVFKVIVHEGFAHKTLNNDIALLKLNTKAIFNDYIQPACMWFDITKEKLPATDVVGAVAGWGFDQSDLLSPELRFANMPLIPDLACIRRKPQFYTHFLNGKKFCAGTLNGTSACNGDSGGGYVVFIPDTNSSSEGAWYLRGIVSIAFRREDSSQTVCDPNEYVLFTDINEYKDWIKGHMK